MGNGRRGGQKNCGMLSDEGLYAAGGNRVGFVSIDSSECGGRTMSAVNEWIAREYFEWLGYFVAQPHKYTIVGRHKKAEEEVDLIIHNPLVGAQKVPDTMLWSSADFKDIGCAVIAVRGWHTGVFSATLLEQSPEIMRIADDEVVGAAAKRLGTRQPARILCVPKLPVSGASKRKALAVLKKAGIDGALSFRTMLLELINAVDFHKDYEKSDVLQVLRILKNYDLLKNSQLELFGKKRGGKAGTRHPKTDRPSPKIRDETK